MCDTLRRLSQPADLDAFAEHLASNYVPNTVIIDATASDVPPTKYMQWMQQGIHIITPNKKLNSGPLVRYQALRQFQRDSYIHFLYEVSTRAWTHPACPIRCMVCASEGRWSHPLSALK